MPRLGYGISCFCLVLSFGLSNGATAEVIDKSFHQVFEVHEGAILFLEHGDGDVTIESWDRDTLDIQVIYKADFKGLGWSSERDFTVDFKQDGNEIHVVGRETGVRISVGFHTSRRLEYLYEVKAPKYLDLDLDGEDGDVAIAELSGRIDCQLEDGDLVLHEVAASTAKLHLEDGDLTIQSFAGDLLATLEDGDVRISECRLGSGRIQVADGDVSISRCAGQFEISSQDGDLTLNEVHSKRLDLRTQDGDIQLDLISIAGIDLTVQTQDGDVTVDLQPGISASYSIHTDDGEILVDLPNSKNVSATRGAASGELLGGEGKLRITSQDGSVALRQSSI